MNELAGKIFLSNSLGAWATVIGVILFTFFLKTIISRLVATYLYNSISQGWRDMNKQSFISNVMNPLAWSIVSFVTVVALDRLKFPDELTFKVLGHHSNYFIPKFGVLLIIISLTWLVLGLVNFISWMWSQRTDVAGDQIVFFLRDILKVVVVVSGLLAILQMVFNKDVRGLLQGLTIIGAAVALAAKESLENFIASFIIFFDKPFYVGDIVRVNNINGVVERIGLRSTRIRTLEKTLVTVPNKQMVDTVVDNLSLRLGRRAEIRIEFEASSPADKIEKFTDEVRNILTKYKDKLVSQSAFVTNYNKEGITLLVDIISMPFSLEDFNILRQDINLDIMKLRESSGLQLSNNNSTINLVTGENDERQSPNQSKDLL